MTIQNIGGVYYAYEKAPDGGAWVGKGMSMIKAMMRCWRAKMLNRVRISTLPC